MPTGPFRKSAERDTSSREGLHQKEWKEERERERATRHRRRPKLPRAVMPPFKTGPLGTTRSPQPARTPDMRTTLFVLLGLIVLCRALPLPDAAEKQSESAASPTVEEKSKGVQPSVEFKETPQDGVRADEAPQEVVDAESGDEESSRDEKESAAAVEALSAILEFAKYDVNKDGFIDLGEWSTVHGTVDKSKDHFHSADSNGDKHIAEAEFQAAPWYNEAEPVALSGEPTVTAAEDSRPVVAVEEIAPQAVDTREESQGLPEEAVLPQEEPQFAPEKDEVPAPELRYAAADGEDETGDATPQEPIVLMMTADTPAELAEGAVQQKVETPAVEEAKGKNVEDFIEGKHAPGGKQKDKEELPQVPQQSSTQESSDGKRVEEATSATADKPKATEEVKSIKPEDKVAEPEKLDARAF